MRLSGYDTKRKIEDYKGKHYDQIRGWLNLIMKLNMLASIMKRQACVIVYKIIDLYHGISYNLNTI